MKNLMAMIVGGVLFTFFVASLGNAQELTKVGEVMGEFSRAWDIAFSADGNYAFIPGKGELDPAVWIIDITKPDDPFVTGILDIPNLDSQVPEAWAVKVVGNSLYVAAFKAGLWIYDISDPTDPQEKGGYVEEVESRGLSIVGNYAYVAEAWHGLRILNIEDPENPVQVALYNTNLDALGEVDGKSDAEFHDVKVVGNYAYCAGGNFGLVIVDVSDPASPKGVSYCCDKELIGGGSWARGVEIVGKYAYLGDNGAGLRIVDISDPAEPYEVGFFISEEGGESWKSQVIGNYAYVPYKNEFFILDISDPTDPFEAGHDALDDRGQGVLVKDGYAYVVSAISLSIFDVSAFAPESGLVGHWAFDEMSGPLAGDGSGMSGNGVLEGGAGWAAGVVGAGAIQFNGIDSWVRVSYTAALDFTDQITIAAWMHLDDAEARQNVLQKGSIAIGEVKGGAFTNVLKIDDTWNIYPYSSDAAGYTGAWHHIAMTYDGAEVVNYMDGQVDGTFEQTGTIMPYTVDLGIGTNSPWGDAMFHGSIDDVRIYKKALTASEIQEMYTSTSVEKRITTQIPSEMVLAQNYPNPFNPATSIDYFLPNNAGVSLKVYNLIGKEVATLLNHVQQSAGSYSIHFDASNLNSGIYIYQLKAGSSVLTRKMMLVR